MIDDHSISIAVGVHSVDAVHAKYRSQIYVLGAKQVDVEGLYSTTTTQDDCLASVMLSYLVILSLAQSTIRAAPLEPILARDINNRESLTAASCAYLDRRSEWDIVWSCLVTIFACCWVSVHPNIPGPREGRYRVALRRLEILAWALIAPELIILWAIRQWKGARFLAKKYKEHGWTTTHGHFLQMGGFMLFDSNRSQVGILTAARLKRFLASGNIDFPTITKEEIEDRSKSDGLSKGLVILQTTWFAVQCIARLAQGLVVTEVELVTVAFAALNGIMYFLWWDKPLDARCCVPVYLKGEYDLSELGDVEWSAVESGSTVIGLTTMVWDEDFTVNHSSTLAEGRDDTSFPSLNSPEPALLIRRDSASAIIVYDDLNPSIPDSIASPTSTSAKVQPATECSSRIKEDNDTGPLSASSFNPPEPALFRRRDSAYANPVYACDVERPASTIFAKIQSKCSGIVGDRYLHRIWQWALDLYSLVLLILSSIFFYLPVTLVTTPFVLLNELYKMIVMNYRKCTMERIPTFYALSTPEDEDIKSGLTGRRNALVSAVGIIFGLIHCVGWNFLFPSSTMRNLWRVCSVVIVGGPCITGFFYLGCFVYLRYLYIPFPQSGHLIWSLKTIVQVFKVIPVTITIYIGARFCLLVLAFVALRDLVPGAYAVVEWVSFIPHL
ncbi:hypothetical protein BDZ97DRAFT_1752822 [Flammula alnicola]|nr:hypothetical protein BDZ97DRAFT_1752822 [Flammula alnicola]